MYNIFKNKKLIFGAKNRSKFSIKMLKIPPHNFPKLLLFVVLIIYIFL